MIQKNRNKKINKFICINALTNIFSDVVCRSRFSKSLKIYVLILLKRTFQGTISCVIDPLNNIGGIFLSGLEVAYNIKLLNDNNIKGVLSICGEACYF